MEIKIYMLMVLINLGYDEKLLHFSQFWLFTSLYVSCFPLNRAFLEVLSLTALFYHTVFIWSVSTVELTDASLELIQLAHSIHFKSVTL